ncbi:MAG: hypothetical protein ACRCYX_02595, partial [Dermatophilaceae bacterium]
MTNPPPNLVAPPPTWAYDPRPGLPGSPTHPAGPVATFGQRVPAFLIDLLVNLVGFVPIVAG